MARNTVPLNQIISDFLITMADDDYASMASDVQVRTHALRGIREIGFDMSNKIKSIKIEVNSSNNTIELPDDFVDLSKVGVVGSDGIVYVLGQNKNINKSRAYANSSGTKVGNAASAVDSDGDGVFDRVDSKSATNSGSPGASDDVTQGFNSFIFRNYVYGASNGLYGIGGGHMFGNYRLNLDQNRIELESNDNISEVVIEYLADEARSKNPSVHVYIEEALMAYMYYKIIERKASVPANEKARARQEYYNERRKANARMKSFSKDDALQTIRKNYKQAPKF
jgi:hypothetical protein|tara:strand:- start:342 stop:1187 length:846 start_codon:yes stop_codon:yes gene_type:complete